jgi:hypothetical protein
MNLGSLKSKKLIVAVIAAIGMIVNDVLGKPVGEETIYVVVAYLVSQGIADHGAQGAATAVQRAIKQGVDAADAVKGVLGDKRAPGVAHVHDDEDDGPAWTDTSTMDAEDGPKELNG